MASKAAIERAIARAKAFEPVVLELGSGFYAVSSHSKSGHGWMVEFDGVRSHCECTGFTSTGCCYHVAAVRLSLGNLPQEVQPAEPVTHDVAPLITNRAALWAD